MSDSVCVTKFLESTANFESSLEEQHLESDFVALRTWCVPFQHLIRFSISALKFWEFSTMYRLSMSVVSVVNALKDVLYNKDPHYNPKRTDGNLWSIYIPFPSRTSKLASCIECRSNIPILSSSLNVCNSLFHLELTPNNYLCSTFNRNSQPPGYQNQFDVWTFENFGFRTDKYCSSMIKKSRSGGHLYKLGQRLFRPYQFKLQD